MWLPVLLLFLSWFGASALLLVFNWGTSRERERQDQLAREHLENLEAQRLQVGEESHA